MPRNSNYPPATSSTEVQVGLTEAQVQELIVNYLSDNGYQTGSERDAVVQQLISSIGLRVNTDAIVQQLLSANTIPASINDSYIWSLGVRYLTNPQDIQDMPSDIPFSTMETPRAIVTVVGQAFGTLRVQSIKVWDEGANINDRFYVAFRTSTIDAFTRRPSDTTEWKTFQTSGSGSSSGGQGFQGKFRVYLYNYVAHGEGAPSAPTGATYNNGAIENIPSTWQSDFPGTQASQPDVFDVYESFAEFNPATPFSTLNWSTPFKIDAEAGPAGPAGRDGRDGLRGPQGDRGLQGVQGPAGQDGATGPAGRDGAQGPAGRDGRDGQDGPAGPAGQDGQRGPAGRDGTDGQGVPTGGTAGQVLSKVDATDYNTEWVDAGSIGMPADATQLSVVSTVNPDDATQTLNTITLPEDYHTNYMDVFIVAWASAEYRVNSYSTDWLLNVPIPSDPVNTDDSKAVRIRIGGTNDVDWNRDDRTLTYRTTTPTTFFVEDAWLQPRVSSGSDTFTGLTDTPSTLGTAGQIVASTGSALEFVDPPSGSGTDEVDNLESRLNNISHQSVSITGSDNNPVNFASNQTDALSATVNLTAGVHTLYSSDTQVIATIERESDGSEFSVDESTARRVGDRIAVRVNVPSTADYAARGGAVDTSSSTENIGGANVDGTDLRTAIANARTSTELPQVITDFFEDAQEIHTAGDFIEDENWSEVKEVTFTAADSANAATEYGSSDVTVTYNSSNLGFYVGIPNASTHLLVGITPRSVTNGDVYGFIARSGDDLTSHRAVPLLRVNYSGQYEVGTGINTSVRNKPIKR